MFAICWRCSASYVQPQRFYIPDNRRMQERTYQKLVERLAKEISSLAKKQWHYQVLVSTQALLSVTKQLLRARSEMRRRT